MAEFKVGEVAIYVRPGSSYHGFEITVTYELSSFPTLIDMNDSNESVHRRKGYLVKFPGQYDDYFALPEWLRKKKSPARDIELPTLPRASGAPEVHPHEATWETGLPQLRLLSLLQYDFRHQDGQTSWV